MDTHAQDHHHGNRVDDLRLITGSGKYASDWKRRGQRYGHFLRAVRELRGEEHPTTSKASPLGVKGVGESGCTAFIPSLVSAAIDALHPVGVTQLDMPLTPPRLWHAIEAAKKSTH